MNSSKVWTYQQRVKFVYGAGSINSLPGEFELFEVSRPMIVCGRTAMKKTGTIDRICSLLKEKPVIFDRIPPNPAYMIVDEGASICLQEKCDSVIGIGGGSAIDAAKAIAMMTSHSGSVRDYIEGKSVFSRPGLPIFSIPTTSGTGTEANPFFVLVVPETYSKLSGAPKWSYPKVSFLDPELVASLSDKQTSATGLDVISHAFESLWAKPASPLTDLMAFEAIRLTLKWLPKAVVNGKSVHFRERMMFACLCAGLALSTTKTAVVHGLSYPLTVKWGLEHGFACAFLLPDFLDFLWDSIDESRILALMNVMDVTDKKHAVDMLRSFTLEMGTPISLKEIGVTCDDIDEIINIANHKNISNTFVSVDNNNIKQILSSKL